MRIGLTDVKEATSGAMDTVDRVGGCTGESLSDLQRLFGALDEGSSCLLFTMDVPSVCTSIPYQEGIRALRFFLEQIPEPSPPTTTLLHLAKLVLTLNNFCFNSSHFLQVGRVAMGTRMGPSYACLFVGDRVPLVPTYHPTSFHIQKIIRHHFRHLQRDATTRHMFPSSPLSTFCRDRSLSDTLVHTSFIPNIPPQPYGTFS
eukprot:g45102.t1